jgi:hypothetical protein
MSLAHGNHVHNPGPVGINPSLYCTQQNLSQALNCKDVPDLTDILLPTLRKDYIHHPAAACLTTHSHTNHTWYPSVTSVIITQLDKVPLNTNINDMSMIIVTKRITASHFAAWTTTLVLVTVATRLVYTISTPVDTCLIPGCMHE